MVYGVWREPMVILTHAASAVRSSISET
jgi:hypothetical protein